MFGNIRCPFSAAFQTRKEKYDASIDTTRLFEIVRNIIYWLGSRCLWCYAYTTCDTRANEYVFTNKYAIANGDSNAYEHSRADNYCHRYCASTNDDGYRASPNRDPQFSFRGTAKRQNRSAGHPVHER